MINIEPQHLEIVLAILKKYDYTFYLFGSRTTDKAQKFSDLDLFYKDEIPQKIISSMQEDINISNIPYTVDIINYNTCKPYFQEIIDNNNVLLYEKSNT